MRLLPGLALGAALTTFAVMVAGAYVKALGEGAACPPGILCLESAAEMAHRALVGVLGLFVLGMFLLALRSRAQDRRLFGMCAGALVLLFAQALLGQVTIAVGLHPVVVASHQALALAVFALLLHILFRTRQAPVGAGSA
jgi:cytochrome c oxidase assembly protein subunit 15